MQSVLLLVQNMMVRWKKKMNKDDDHSRRLWDELLPTDILESIMERLNLSDCVRLSVVCKSWRSSASLHLNKKIIYNSPCSWLLLPHHQTGTAKYLKFFDFSGAGIFYDLPLPKCWLVIGSSNDSTLTLFLFNPISGIQLPLPPLQTVPSCRHHAIQQCPEFFGHDITEFAWKIELSSSDASSSSCVVAAIFYEQEGLALCRPRDKSWTIFPQVDKDQGCVDVLFSNGMLHALEDLPR
ncbi:hypothetical protein Ddye_001652 [Dipteronia dyeriana]|uniref:F-box domain-containing protein n=1 Tax=Dipteronia dyeriana TaxID=168575 RepID=A0AAD9XPL0_9ROSI|nr:hypothetical protein Ddye_001652 [Dipteronia dyeriana]